MCRQKNVFAAVSTQALYQQNTFCLRRAPLRFAESQNVGMKFWIAWPDSNGGRTRWAIEKLFAHEVQVFRIERTVYHTKPNGKTIEIVSGLINLPPHKASPAKLLALTREYWQIESGLHNLRGVTLREDITRLTVGNSGHNRASLNNLGVCLCLRGGFHNLDKARCLFDAKPKEALNLILSATPRLCESRGEC